MDNVHVCSIKKGVVAVFLHSIFLFFFCLFVRLLFAPTYEGGVVSNGLPSRFQSVMWFMMSLVAESGVSCRPMHSTKSPSGSWSEPNMSARGLITNEDME
jgi:hypothetical protein